MARPIFCGLRGAHRARGRDGLPRRAARCQFEVSVSCVIKLMQRRRDRDTLQPDRLGGAWRSTPAAYAAARLHALMAAAPSADSA
jgi:hypothetical protein